MRYSFLLILLFTVIKLSAQKADTVYYNGQVYTLDSIFSIKQAFAVKDGKFVKSGSDDELINYPAKTFVNLNGKFVYPGFIDAHCHFYGYGVDLKKISLTGTTSFENILDTLKKYRDRKFMGWIFGRGWDQNDWNDTSYPDNSILDSLFPDVPVFLLRIDGHAALVNSKALQIAGITADSKVEGGEFIKSGNKLTGLLIDNAFVKVEEKIPKPELKAEIEALLTAQKNCFEVGLTTVSDAGLSPRIVMLVDSLQKAGKLKMRMYAMLTCDKDGMDFAVRHGRYITDKLTVRSFKLYADGALGSRGACLRHPYHDKPGHHGFLLAGIDSIISAAGLAFKTGYQVNTHCIGDSANHLLLEIYCRYLKTNNDLRWRIEHAQVLSPEDFKLFKDYRIIPSVQPTHATSDMYWAQDRIGKERIQYAYAYNELLKNSGIIAAGSDFPVEDINPLFGFYAAVSRKDQKGYPASGFEKTNAVSRTDALKAMTIWAAKANFEDHVKGSIEPGKVADFVIMDQDIMSVPESEIFKQKVRSVYINGEPVLYNRTLISK